jgi:hypothetical protein
MPVLAGRPGRRKKTPAAGRDTRGGPDEIPSSPEELMSSVRRPRRPIKFRLPAPQWPESPIDEHELDYLRDVTRVGYIGDAPVSAYDLTPSLPAAEWVEGQVAWHRYQHESFDPTGAHKLIAFELEQLARRLAGRDSAAVLGYVPRYVPVPEPSDYRHCYLAYEIVTQAALLYPYDSAVRRLAARCLVRLADLVKLTGAEDAEEFLRDEAAFRDSSIDAMMEATSDEGGR